MGEYCSVLLGDFGEGERGGSPCPRLSTQCSRAARVRSATAINVRACLILEGLSPRSSGAEMA